MSKNREIFLSVDVETSGPIPGEYSMLTIGACNVDDPEQVFSCSLKPISSNADPKAMEVTGLSLETLAAEGLPPEVAMKRFQDWVAEVAGDLGTPVFVGFNAPVCRVQRAVRLVVRQLLLPPLPELEPLRLCRAGHQGALHGSDGLKLGRHPLQPGGGSTTPQVQGRPSGIARRTIPG